MLNRHIEALLRERLASSPAVVLLGPRQVGKTTLARAVAAGSSGALFLDMERTQDRAALGEPELFLATQRHRLVVIDEVQLVPNLFSALRPEIDADRRSGRFLLLGSASGELLHQSAQSLAGRVAYVELPPFLATEAVPIAEDLPRLQQLWLRGGFPLSWLAPSDEASLQWRQEFIRTFLFSDLGQMGVRIPGETLRRFWTMLAHLQGQFFNAARLGQSLGGASHTTTARYLDTLVDALVVRRLQPMLPNVGKRLVKSPKIYVRDSGLLHALLGLRDVPDLQGHDVAGSSWEGFVIEQIAAAAGADAELGYYRTTAGAEIDLVVQQGSRRIGFEVKFSAAPQLSRGFWQAREDLQLDAAYVVAPVALRYPLAEGVQVLPVAEVGSAMTVPG